MAFLDCRPPYNFGNPPAFVPNFIPNGDCEAPIFNEKRARLFAGGTFFRSKFAGSTTNLISIELIGGSPRWTLNVYFQDELHETFTTDVADIIIPPPCDTPLAADALRSEVNGVSHLIEMPDEDFGGVELSGGLGPTPTPIFDSSTDDFCLSDFSPTPLSGGEGPPTDIAGLNAIRTGPQRALSIISRTEIIENDATDVGELVLPPAEERTRQYNGFDWVRYTPNSDCTLSP